MVPQDWQPVKLLTTLLSGLSPEWILRCAFRDLACAKRLPHWSHMCNFSPVWILTSHEVRFFCETLPFFFCMNHTALITRVWFLSCVDPHMIFAVFCMIQMLSALGTRVCLASSVDFDVLQKLNEQGVAFIFWAIVTGMTRRETFGSKCKLFI